MKNIRPFTISFILILILLGCAYTHETLYFSKNFLKSDPERVIKKAHRNHDFGIQQYKDSIFPNRMICDLKSLKSLSINNTNFYLYKINPMIQEKYTDNTVMIENIPFNTNCLDSLTSLSVLRMSGFIFDEIPMELSHLVALEELWFTFFQVKQIPVDFRKFKNLKKIYWELYSFTNPPDSLVFPESMRSVNIKAVNMSLPNRIKLIKAILKNPQIEKIGFFSKSDEETCIIYDVIKENALNNRVYSMPFFIQRTCERIEREKRFYKYD